MILHYGGYKMNNLTKIAEGKSKIIYIDNNKMDVYLEFKGDVRCSHQRVQYDERIAILRAMTSYKIFCYLYEKNVKQIVLPELVTNSMLKMKKVYSYPLEWIPRYYAAGSVVKRFGFMEGYKFKKPLLKIDYKTNTEDYLITDEFIIELGLLNATELQNAKKLCMEIANILKTFFLSKELVLWDFKLELGKNYDGTLCLIDEISFDGMRLKDSNTGESLDKDIYRQTGDIEKLIKAYQAGYERLFG